MSNDEREVEAAVERLFQAIEIATNGGGGEAIHDAWHHLDSVTTGHPSGGWAQGWEEVKVTWDLLSSFGRAGRGGSSMHSLAVNVVGDLAYSTCVFKSSPTFGSVELLCSNVLQRIDGVWKIVHHHVDKSPEVAAAFEKIARGD